MEKRQRRGLSLAFAFLLTCSFRPYPPDSVDNRITAFECAGTARRSRTTERSESVSEEAEECRKLHFLLTHLCGISHRLWCTFHTIRTDAA
ncbi:hypothetical protein HT118_30845 [Escherichia coli]|nr:hypothetical protein [Escherichia coli]